MAKLNKDKLNQLIRTIVREEVAMAIHEVVTELKQPTKTKVTDNVKSQKVKKVVHEKKYTDNSILNDVLNETAQDEEWKTMGGGTYDSSKANEILSSNYGGMMDEKPSADQMVASMGVSPEQVPNDVKDALTRDYSGLMKAIDKKRMGKK